MSTEFNRTEVSTYYAQRVPRLKQTEAVEWRGPCPVHAGMHNNFSVNSENGLWTCHSQCARGGDILKLEAELTGGDYATCVTEVFRLVGRAEPDGGHRGSHTSRDSASLRELARYPYYSAEGQLLYEVVRFESKKFTQRRPDGNGGWIPNLNGVPRVPYRLPRLIAESDRPIFVAEGEKDVESLESCGLLATCNPGGSGGKSVWTDWAPKYFNGRQVALIPDNDSAGQRLVEAEAAALLGVAASVRVLELPGLLPKGDVSDWREEGGTREELLKLADEAPILDVVELAELRARWGFSSEKPGRESKEAGKLETVCAADVEAKAVS